ncbi:hypothetical protein [Demequina litorisediminis]|uniref:Uncharacterized protein n=1 Tax=Demequina litorisediminis TaxID=1849022 RepID=A0ABQ6I8A4_9MICO|nr:hypothetical protein [Demequina litorisediminis]GMA33844.1 hypothetical protein GCM10025876_00480 [Demequina litorisediminis]
MTTKKQAKANAKRQHSKLEARQAAKRAAHERRIRIVAAITVAALVLGAASTLIVMAVINSGNDDVAATPTQTADASASDDAISTSSGWANSPEPPDPSTAESRQWSATIATNLGDITVTLDGENAPQATASLHRVGPGRLLRPD